MTGFFFWVLVLRLLVLTKGVEEEADDFQYVSSTKITSADVSLQGSVEHYSNSYSLESVTQCSSFEILPQLTTKGQIVTAYITIDKVAFVESYPFFFNYSIYCAGTPLMRVQEIESEEDFLAFVFNFTDSKYFWSYLPTCHTMYCATSSTNFTATTTYTFHEVSVPKERTLPLPGSIIRGRETFRVSMGGDKCHDVIVNLETSQPIGDFYSQISIDPPSKKYGLMLEVFKKGQGDHFFSYKIECPHATHYSYNFAVVELKKRTGENVNSSGTIRFEEIPNRWDYLLDALFLVFVVFVLVVIVIFLLRRKLRNILFVGSEDMEECELNEGEGERERGNEDELKI